MAISVKCNVVSWVFSSNPLNVSWCICFGFLLRGWSVGEMGEKPNSKEILQYRGDFKFQCMFVK
jgi:hypothetical protein